LFSLSSAGTAFVGDSILGDPKLALEMPPSRAPRGGLPANFRDVNLSVALGRKPMVQKRRFNSLKRKRFIGG
jgi:hypothetical protein